jgi:hypothetical protein
VEGDGDQLAGLAAHRRRADELSAGLPPHRPAATVLVHLTKRFPAES